MDKSPLTQKVGEYERRVVSEDGVHYREEKQDMKPVLDHVRFLSEKVNGAPKAGNTNDMHYLGSIPMTVLTDWCQLTGVGLDAYARNQFGEKQTFINHLKANFPVFLAAKKKSSQIIMPG